MAASTDKYNYSFLHPTGVDHRLIALYAVRRITNGYTSASYVRNECWEERIQTFISNVIYRSDLSIGILIFSLCLVERTQTVMKRHNQCSEVTINEAKRLFLISFMVAAKIMLDNQMTLVWWKRVVQREYDCDELSGLELKFYQTLEWDIQMDQQHFYRIFRETMAWHDNFVAEHTLPASPLPTYDSRIAIKGSRLGEDPMIVSTKAGLSASDRSQLPLPCSAAVDQSQSTTTVYGSVMRFSRRLFQRVEAES